MFLLLIVSFVWAFSFGLIKGRLTGIDPTAVAALRLGLALLVFLPFYRYRRVPLAAQLRLIAIGAVQFGVMYIVYLRAFVHLQAYEVALFTITTPIFVALLDGARQRQFVAAHLLAAILSVAGAGVVVWQRVATSDAWVGILLVQFSNVCFAAGQIAWRSERAKLDSKVSDAAVFGLLYGGAVLASAGWSIFTTDWATFRLSTSQTVTIVYLGVLASGVCFFWWNIGATKVNAGTLAAFNNAKIPLAVACSLVFFHEKANVSRLLVGGALMVIGVLVSEWSRWSRDRTLRASR